MIDEKMLSMLVCPADGSALKMADASTVAKINRAIAGGRVKNRAGRVVQQPIEGGLTRADQTLLYPILDGIPVLLPDEAIPTATAGTE